MRTRTKMRMLGQNVETLNRQCHSAENSALIEESETEESDCDSELI
jgi:hypothetical protein